MTSKYMLLIVGLIMMLSYQNCANKMSFDGAGVTAGKIDSVNTPDGVGDDPAPGQDPIAMLPPGDTDQDTDIDYDYDNHRVAFSCTTGATLKFDEAALTQADDLTLKNAWRLLFYYSRPLRYVDVQNLKGSIAVKNALRIDSFKNISGLVSYARAASVTSVENIQAGISSTAGIKINEVRNVHAGYICASGSEIGKMSDLHGLFMKFRGRPATGAAADVNGKATEISNVHSGFTSIYKLDVALLSNVDGELIIRNSTIDSIENFSGGLTLINSKVRSLKNAKGKLRTLNSTVDSQTNVSMDLIELIRK
ncbi:hypothetical protein BH10BDE1_BH10BDE1_10180 [soil metagenome]